MQVMIRVARITVVTIRVVGVEDGSNLVEACQVSLPELTASIH